MAQLTGALKKTRSVTMSNVSSDALISSTGSNINNLDYVGLDTSTVDVTVDNEGRTISAKITPSVMNSIQVKDEQIKTLTAQVNTLSTDIVSSLETMNSLAEELSVEVAKQKQLSEETANKQQVLQKNYSQTITQMKSQYSSDIDRLEAMVENLKSSMPNVKSDIQIIVNEIIDDIIKIEANIEALSVSNEHYKSNIDKHIKKLETADTSLQTQIANLKNDLQNVQEAQDSSVQRFDEELSGLVDNYNVLVEEFDSRCSELSVKLNNLSFVYQQNCQQFDNSINNIYSTLEYIQINHTTDINALRTSIKNLSTNVTKIENSLKNSDTLISAQIVDVKRTLVNMYDYYYVIALKHTQDINDLKESDISLQTQVIDLETKYESLKSDLSLLSEDHDSFKEDSVGKYDHLSETVDKQLKELTASLVDVNNIHLTNYDRISSDLAALVNRLENIEFVDAGDAYRFIGTI